MGANEADEEVEDLGHGLSILVTGGRWQGNIWSKIGCGR